MGNYIEILEELVDSKKTSFYTENFHAIDLAIKKLLKRLKDLEHIEQKHKEINGQLRQRVKELEEKLEEKDMQHELELIGKEEYTKQSMGEIIEHYYTANEDCIPKSKIKEKIEEKNSRIEKYRKHIEQGIETDIEWVDNVADREIVQVLKELIEE